MVFRRLFAHRPARAAGQALYASAARQARDPRFYVALGAPDTGEGRFELYVLHVALLVLRLKGQGGPAAEAAQQLFDAFIKALDDGLREMGVGDLVVGKRMRKLGEAFYGRARSYEEALARMPDRSELQALIARTILPVSSAGAASMLADYVAAAAAGLEAQPLDRLLKGEAIWPEAPR
jgi:cytochrome b pre-mRNA-processing protein 3